MKELFDLFTRLVLAVEKLAAGGGTTAAEEPKKAEKPKKEKPAEPKPEEKPAPKKDPFGDDDDNAPPAVVVTKEQVRKALSDYANATNNETALGELAKCTTNKAGRVPDIKPEEYAEVFKKITALLEATKK